MQQWKRKLLGFKTELFSDPYEMSRHREVGGHSRHPVSTSGADRAVVERERASKIINVKIFLCSSLLQSLTEGITKRCCLELKYKYLEEQRGRDDLIGGNLILQELKNLISEHKLS